MAVPKVLAKQLAELRTINTVLAGDVDRSRDELQAAHDRYVAGAHDSEDLNYAVKSAIRCFFGQIDGVSYALRNAVVQAAPSMNMNLSSEDRRFLRRKSLNPRKSLPAGYDHFALLCGSPLRLDTSTVGWTAFDELVKTRKAFTHPENIQGIIAAPALRYIRPALIWFPFVMDELLADCGERFGVKSTRLPEDLDVRIELEGAVLDTDEIFDDEFLQAVGYSAGISIAHLHKCLSLLWNETSRAQDDCKSSAHGQYERRRLIQTLFSNIEGMMNLLRFTLAKASERGELVLSAADLASLDSGEIEDRLVATATLWSREVGNGHTPPRDPRFAAITVARGMRNRITHPRAAGYLHVASADLAIVHQAIDWFIFCLSDSLAIDAEKWIKKLPKTAPSADVEPAG